METIKCRLSQDISRKPARSRQPQLSNRNVQNLIAKLYLFLNIISPTLGVWLMFLIFSIFRSAVRRRMIYAYPTFNYTLLKYASLLNLSALLLF